MKLGTRMDDSLPVSVWSALGTILTKITRAESRGVMNGEKGALGVQDYSATCRYDSPLSPTKLITMESSEEGPLKITVP